MSLISRVADLASRVAEEIQSIKDDPRWTDARPPTTHSHTTAPHGFEVTGNLGLTGNIVKSTFLQLVAPYVAAQSLSVADWVEANHVVLNGGAPSQANHAANKAYVDSMAPIGSVTMFAGGSAPTGYLQCQGQAISRTTYAALFDVIGTMYGAGNGSTCRASDFVAGRLSQS